MAKSLCRASTLVLVAVSLMLLNHTAQASPAPGGSHVQSVATCTYIPSGMTQSETVSSNSVQVQVLATEALTLTQDQSVLRPPGDIITLNHLLTNTGNVASSYMLTFANNGTGCVANTLDLSGLSLLRDTNNNGVADKSDTTLLLGSAGALTLQAGETASLLVQGKLPSSSSGRACLILTVSTDVQAVSAANHDLVTISNGAVLSLTQSVNYSGVLVPGSTQLDFILSGSNIGAQPVLPTAVAAPTNTTIMVNGSPINLVLISDLIPVGTEYLPGSLQSTALGAIRLYRLPGDPAFNYRTVEDASAVEVAIGLPSGVSSDSIVAARFSVVVNANLTTGISNIAQTHYNDGSNSVVSSSNTIVIAYLAGRLGVAKSASSGILNHAVDGTLDGTATVHFSVLLRNYGSAVLYEVQAPDLMEGTGATQFGTYTANAMPAVNQYTIVPGTMAIVTVGSMGVAVNPGFHGSNSTSTGSNLLAPGASLLVGGDVTIQFDARINLRGRTGTLYNTVRGQAAMIPGGNAIIFDDSVNGTNPDANGTGNPNDAASPTPVKTLLSALTMVETVSLPRRISSGVFELDYHFKVINNGQAPATNVRVIDNLNCTFGMDQANGAIASWTLVNRPVIQNGLLNSAAGFTGSAICNRASGTGAYAAPAELALSLVDGSRALAPGQIEEITLTVRVTEKAIAIGVRTSVSNEAWVVAMDQNSIAPTTLIAAAASTVDSMLLDPQGTVYNAATRAPIAGAMITVTRQSCSSGTLGPITAAEIYGSTSGAYTFNANGTVSMNTGADGSWQFFFVSPPVINRCTYGIVVTPPAGSSYVVPSTLIPPTKGVFTSCGAIVPNAVPPQNGDPTTYYNTVQAGLNPDNSYCEVVHNHIPMDPGNVLGLVLRKDGSKTTAEFGDFIDYALTLTNKIGFPVTGVTFNDHLPAGFAYVPNSARLNGVATPNPAGGAGPDLVFSFPDITLAAGQSVMVRYRLRIGVGAPTSGDAVNRARSNSGPIQSNQASWRVRVTGGVFSDDAFAFGKVYMDCAADQTPGQNGQPILSENGEVGVPGVRLWMEDGTNAVTDAEGKWSLYGLKSITHVLRVDETTLPPGARLTVLDNRNAGNPASRFVDLKKGEFHKANFVISNCAAPQVLQDVIARRKAIANQPDADGEVARTRLDPQGKVIVLGDTRNSPASGKSGPGGATGNLMPVTQALIALPVGTINTNDFVNATDKGVHAGAPFKSLIPVAGNNGIGNINTDSSLLPMDTSSLLPQAMPSDGPLEDVMSGLDNTPGFIDLHDGDTVPARALNVRVKGMIGTDLRISINDAVQDDKRVGKKASSESNNLEAWEYIGVTLKPGVNVLRLDMLDSFSIVRGSQQLSVTAPDQLSLIHIDLPAKAQADLRTPVVVKVRLTDAAGVPVTARTQVTLEADRGRWLDDNLSPDAPGLQTFIQGGVAEFHLLPPGEPGDLRIRVTAGALVKENHLILLPELRPMIGVGIVEGTLDLTKRGSLAVGQMPAGAAFETELTSLSGNDSTTSARAGERSAFFFKGAIKGEYLLTAAFDSAKASKERLFRDIRPDEFYPIYGDSSIRGFDAQSTQKVYVRIDKNRSYLLYGDFTTTSSSEVRQLSQTNRTLTGAKNIYETDIVRATTYVSRTAQTQQIVEFPALGISGPYFLTAGSGELLANSEKIEILVRDRNQPNIVLLSTPASRFVDYTIEPLTQRLLFMRPISSVDSNLNPQSIRITYEVDTGGPQFTVAGTDVQAKVNDKLQVGAIASTDQNPDNRRNLKALTAIARVGAGTTVATEVVTTDTDLKGSGNAARMEVRHQDAGLSATAQVVKTTSTFDNPGATFVAGHTEAGAKSEYKINDTTQVRSEVLYSKDALSTGARKGVAVGVQKKLNDTLTAEIGMRHGENSSATASMFDYNQQGTGSTAANTGSSAASPITSVGTATAAVSGSALTTVRGRLTTVVPYVPQAQVFIEAEQDVEHSDRHLLSVGGSYAVTDKTRVYGRYELVSTLDSLSSLNIASLNPSTSMNTSASRNVGLLGIESNYMEGGRVYNEYRLADALDGRTGQAAMGIRNTIKLNAQWSITAGIERTSTFGGGSNGSSGTRIVGLGNSTAVISGVEYAVERIKANAILEARQGDDSNTYLSSAGLGIKLNADWSLLGRSLISDTEGKGASTGNNRLLARQQIGLAYRPVSQDLWNALARYEHKIERVDGAGTAQGSAVATAFGIDTNPAGNYVTDIVAAHINYNPVQGSYVTARYAAKITRADDGFLASTYWAHLVQGRYTQDLNKNWDIGIQAGLMVGKGGALQKTAGAELGYQLLKDLWVSGGYNIVGLKDRDLTAGEYTSKGVYIRLRFKFDETSLGFATPAAAPGKRSDVAGIGTSASPTGSLP